MIYTVSILPCVDSSLIILFRFFTAGQRAPKKLVSLPTFHSFCLFVSFLDVIGFFLFFFVGFFFSTFFSCFLARLRYLSSISFHFTLWSIGTAKSISRLVLSILVWFLCSMAYQLLWVIHCHSYPCGRFLLGFSPC